MKFLFKIQKVALLALPVAFLCCSGENSAEVELDEGAAVPDGTPDGSSLSGSSSSASTPKSSSSSIAKDLGLPAAGFYTSLELNAPVATKGGVVRCTFDGSEPTETTAEAQFPYAVTTNTAVRCTEFVGAEVVAKQTETYFVGAGKIGMPVVALSVSPVFFSDYVSAPPCKPDPCKSAKFWEDVEFPVHVEYFAEGSSSQAKAFDIDAGISIMGGYSRNQIKKSVSVVMRKQYQDGRLKYPLFDTRPDSKKFKGFILRNNGNRFVSDYLADPMAVSLLEGTTVDYQRSRQVVVYYNGKYYGIHDMREKLNEHFVETNYKIDSKEVDFVKHINVNIKETNGSSASYVEMLQYAATADFTKADGDALATLSTMLDLYNYADYMAAEIYFHNGDWPNNNVRAWHTASQPWHFIAYDIDHGLGWMWNVKGFSEKIDMFDWIEAGGSGSCSGSDDPLCFHNLFRNLMKSPVFQRIFVNRASVLYGIYLNAAKVAQKTDAMAASMTVQEISKDMITFPRDEYWYSNYCGDGFDTDGSCLKTWAADRDVKVRNEFRKKFGLGDDVTLNFSSQGGGYIAVEGFQLPSSYSGAFFGGMPMVLNAVPTGGGMFIQWEDGSTDNPRVVTPQDGAEYKATFK
jgi:CotH protein.